MLYVIYAADQIYNGYHGLSDWTIEDCNNINDASEIGFENSLEIINDYSIIYEELEKEVEDEIDFADVPITEEKEEEIRYEVYSNDVLYDIFEIKSEYQKEDIFELERILQHDPEEFIKKYCEDRR